MTIFVLMKQYHLDFLSHLSSADPILHKVATSNGEILLRDTDTPFRHLVRIITGQQLSVKAATTIYGRLEHFVGQGYEPEHILELNDDVLRSIGFSRSKTIYIKAVAEAAGPKCENFNSLSEKSDEEVIKVLTNIKGIGVWSAQMFLMFQMQRLDVFAPRDLGLKKGVSLIYGVPMDSPEKVWIAHAKIWSPYRTLASLHLWKYVDNYYNTKNRSL